MVKKIPVVDSHHHFVDPDHANYPWVTGPKLALKKRFMVEEFRPVLAENGVDASILVQTRIPMDETREWLALAAETDFVAGVIGWVDLTSPSVATDLAELRAGRGGEYLVGVRHKLHDEADSNWILRDDVWRGLAAVQAAGIAFDLLVRPRELPTSLETVRRFPGLRFVIEHIAKPDIVRREMAAWRTGMAPFAEQPHVWCKLSGMVMEADLAHWKAADFSPYVTAVMGWFGEDRLMFGSDWPVCLLGGTYAQIKVALETCLGAVSAAAKAKIFGGNAIKAYGLNIA
jgi:L-fuconolactonase